MPLNFHPKIGTIVICDYSTGFIAPEMVKIRPVVVVSPRFRSRSSLCTVIPLSSTVPKPFEGYHYALSSGAYPPAQGPMWAKCDMIATVSLSRLDRIKVRDSMGGRSFRTFAMPSDDLAAIQKGIKIALGLERPTATF